MNISYNLLLFLIIIFILIWIKSNRHNNIENFNVDQTTIPQDQPAALSWNFESPKSSIKNYNETNTVHQDLNILRGDTSSIIGLNQPRANPIFTYTMLNERWDRYLVDITIKIEKDFNNNRMLEFSNNAEWQQKFPYLEVKWSLVPDLLQNIIQDIIDEINNRFNITPPSVGFRKDPIKYYWISHTEVIIIILVYKLYTACDIEYIDDLNPHINDELKTNWERQMIIYIDHLDNAKRYHLKYLRFPTIKYNRKDALENQRSIKEFDNYFYLARSKDDFYYRTFTNTEARDEYLYKVQEAKEKIKYKCFGQTQFGQQTLQRTDDQTTCELADGYWDRKCEKDTDCPYYRANRNYPNNLGGCNKKTGFCKWPQGLQSFSYRKPEGVEKALCYNCMNGLLGSFTIGRCCPDQKDQRVYANLLTPDYAYPDDTSARFQYRDLFDRYNLNWSKFT